MRLHRSLRKVVSQRAEASPPTTVGAWPSWQGHHFVSAEEWAQMLIGKRA
jgi:hypothetical protein